MAATDISLDWSEPVTIEEEKFPEDILDRQKYAQFLTNFLASQGYDSSREEGQQKRNYVMNLNSGWGSGKTYFLKRWSEDLKQHFPVVYIDAWKQDYSDDPLMTVVASVIKQLREQAGKAADDVKFSAPRKLAGMFKAAAPGMANAVAKKLTGIDFQKVFDAEDEGDIEEVTGDDGKPIDMGKAAADATKHLISEHEGRSKAIDSLKLHVAQWVEAVIGLSANEACDKNKNYPAFIFIDELDRCRPSYAVEMLETIKHIFDIPGVVFVVATDTEQLQHAIKAVYGTGFGAKKYLSRFFHNRMTLPKPDIENLIQVHCDYNKLSLDYLHDKKISIFPENVDTEETASNITAILNSFNIPARSSIQIADRLIATLSNTPISARIDILSLTILLCIKELDEQLYTELSYGDFERREVSGTQNISEILKEHYKIDQHYVKMVYSTQSYGEFSSGQNSSKNLYAEESLIITIEKYVQEIFSQFFCRETNKPSLMTLGHANRNRKHRPTKIEKCEKDLIEKYRTQVESEKNKEDIAALWFKLLFFKSGFGNTKAKVYRDLVEFSTALDWMNEE